MPSQTFRTLTERGFGWICTCRNDWLTGGVVFATEGKIDRELVCRRIPCWLGRRQAPKIWRTIVVNHPCPPLGGRMIFWAHDDKLWVAAPVLKFAHSRSASPAIPNLRPTGRLRYFFLEDSCPKGNLLSLLRFFRLFRGAKGMP